MRQLRSAFVTGILVLVPLVATIHIFLWLVRVIENSTRTFLPTYLLPFDFSGLGVVLAIVLIFVTGLTAQNYIGRWVFTLFDGWIRRIAVVGGVYGGIKKFFETFLNPSDDRFKGTVLVQFPRTGQYSIGFRTGSPDPKIAKTNPKKLANVFVPCTPNPTSGFYLMVPEDELVTLDLSVQEAFKIVISMGLVTSDEASQKTN